MWGNIYKSTSVLAAPGGAAKGPGPTPKADTQQTGQGPVTVRPTSSLLIFFLFFFPLVRYVKLMWPGREFLLHSGFQLPGLSP